MKIGVLLITYEDEKTILQNLFNSLKDADIYEMCIANTSATHTKEFEEWLYNEISSAGISVGKVRHIPDWQERQVDIRNELIEMSESDWLLALDSDEMLTVEMAKDLKAKLESLPDEALCLRVKKLNLVDDTHCLSDDLWNGRPPIGHHPQIFRRGTGKFLGNPSYDSKRHPIYGYNGRATIPYNAPEHPCKDWDGYYMIHLWLYQDMPLRWPEEKWQRKEKDDKVKRGDTLSYLDQRGRKIIELPKIATWRKIII